MVRPFSMVMLTPRMHHRARGTSSGFHAREVGSARMRREVFGWWSERLGMDMPIIRYGEWGPALLWFPTWRADAFEAESQGLIHAIHHHIEAGRLTMFCVNSVNASAWYNDS